MSAIAPPLAAQGLTQRLRGRGILHGCTFALSSGTTALLGPNGAGKTVLLRTLAGITPAVAGRVWLGGGEAAGPADLLRQVAYVPQFPGVHPRLTVRDHLERTARWHRIAGPRGSAEEAAERLGLARWLHVAAGRLGAAQRHRLALAEAWVRRARIVLFDEPTADLDPEERAVFWTELAALPAEAALVTTHLFDEVRAHCRSAVMLQGGRVRFAGSVSELAAAADGCCFLLASEDGCPPGSLVVGIGPGGIEVLSTEPLPAPARAPGPLDGYLHVLGVPAAAGLAVEAVVRDAPALAAADAEVDAELATTAVDAEVAAGAGVATTTAEPTEAAASWPAEPAAEAGAGPAADTRARGTGSPGRVPLPPPTDPLSPRVGDSAPRRQRGPSRPAPPGPPAPGTRRSRRRREPPS